jgi:hypothetical protein
MMHLVGGVFVSQVIQVNAVTVEIHLLLGLGKYRPAEITNGN